MMLPKSHNLKSRINMERDNEILVWTISEDRARRFVGVSADALVRIVETELKVPDNCDPNAKLYAVTVE